MVVSGQKERSDKSIYVFVYVVRKQSGMKKQNVLR